ncbi:2-succinyl-5-enolpyruvyl-6-hydroxy-3-cyclohexene-1-carboxylic-acid synthase [Calothrix sp. NIES-3974]|uniref:2-succinyl-5-enolpyruvyl-6-hydroxy-3- cyclohexene-1-carboxylic-acid synthase n=1 Tax=Calothrix sp. NIES-3974 TaxID=2005462 RepID=UPI000B5E49B3|nr:2-succinyl-5-enolpyruvyl-6-hydroxy-3-cyclohexene-1-carboxylic-acid synthase [Calothrix sp. NIES-3974]BAZ03425.1 2-succinyl-6-hydroxy-2,4-cyclohexadiene-1-carboxylate synthase [Calothrix sp. NIES-3974]
MNFRNVNEVWGYVFAEVLFRLGLRTVVICPGSRSTPLTMAFAGHPQIEAIPVLDERSGAFLALGRGLVTGVPTAVVCTSGTAGANFYPAVIEASESRVPLLLLTADRPPELRFCHSGQTIDQVKLFGNYPNWYGELNIPGVDRENLTCLRQTLVYAWERCLLPIPGVVHLNVPFRDPLAPVGDGVDLRGVEKVLDDDFFQHLNLQDVPVNFPTKLPLSVVGEWKKVQRGIIIAGVARPQHPEQYCQAIAGFSRFLNFPVLAEGLSPVRNHADLFDHLVCSYDSILRRPDFANSLVPDVVIQVGELPTSKVLRGWLQKHQCRTWVIDPTYHNLDALHNPTTHLRIHVEEIALPDIDTDNSGADNFDYQQKWLELEFKTQQHLQQIISQTTDLFAGKAPWLLSQYLPPNTNIFIANSMAVRDVEFFWQPNSSRLRPFFNRGANGIDGTLSTALGVAHRQSSSVLLTGDLALLHDTNGFLIRHQFIGHLTIILINNNGGGIFEMLPISQFDPPFTDYFLTPQQIDFSLLCQTYGVEYHLITSWSDFQTKLNPLPTQGIRVLELPTNGKFDANWRREYL